MKATSGNPDEGDGSSSDDDGKNDLPRKGTFEVNKPEEKEHMQSPNNSSAATNNFDTYRSLGVNGLVKAFDKDDKYSGSYDDDLERSIRRFKTLAKMCEVPLDQRLHAIPIMLKGDALDFFDDYQEGCTSYEDAFTLLRNWYLSAEQRARVLAQWQNLRLSKEMAKRPDDSEVSVFRSFVAKLVTLQKQLDRK